MLNYGRKIGLIVADDNGNAFDLSSFRVTFNVARSAEEKPNEAAISIYNLSDTTYSQISTAMKRIVLQAGYESNYAVIFDGNIKKASRTREGADIIIDIEAGDGDQAYNYAVVTQSIASGYTQADIAKASNDALKGQGTRAEDLQAVNTTTRYPRGRVMFGAARNYARQMAKANECNWSIQDGKVVFCKIDTPTDDLAFVLSPTSGMIGAPEIDEDGITVRSVLNPQLKIYDPIQVESEFIKGVYKIIGVTHAGDTHSSTWETEVKAVALDGSTKKTVTK